MSQVPANYTPQTSFSAIAAQPISTTGLPGAQMDAELSRAASSINAIGSRLSEVQRDDGKLRNGVVDASALGADVMAMIIASGANPRTWASGTAFKKGDLISAPQNTRATVVYGTSSPALDGFYLPTVLVPGNPPDLFCVARNSVIEYSSFNGRWQIKPRAADSGHQSTFPSAFAAYPGIVAAWEPTSGGGGGYPVVIDFFPGAIAGTYLCIQDHTSSISFELDTPSWATIAAKPEVGDLVVNQFAGNGVQTAFVLSVAPIEEVNTQVFINGLYQPKTAYSLAGSTITFAAAPANASVIEVVSGIPSQTTLLTVSNFAITTDKLAALAVTEPKLADLSISTRAIQNGAVGSAQIADSAITADKLSIGCITEEKYGALSIASGAIKADAIIADKLAENSVTSRALAPGSVGSNTLAAGPISLQGTYAPTLPSHIVTKDYFERALSVSGAMIQPLSITNAKIALNSITAGLFAKSGSMPIQIRQATKLTTETIAGTATSWNDIADLSFAITRVNVDGRMRVQASINCASNSAYPVLFRVMRGSTEVASGTTAGSRISAASSGGGGAGSNDLKNVSIDIIDDLSGVGSASPTYKIQCRVRNGSTAYINRTITDSNDADGTRASSTMTLTELSS